MTGLACNRALAFQEYDCNDPVIRRLPMLFVTLLSWAFWGGAAIDSSLQDITDANADMVARYYPLKSIRRGEEGSVEFQVTLNRAGSLTSCKITKSSGFPALDERTCDIMVETARFKSIRNSSGWRVNSVHDGRLVWRIPDDKLPEKLAVQRKNVALSSEDRIICRQQLRQGSLYVMERLCFSAADWRRQREYSQGALHAMQSPGGPVF